MVEVNIRVFVSKRDMGIFPDYHRHIAMVRELLQGKVKLYLDATYAVPIYQYYSLSPLCYIEVRYLRRMQITKSVMNVTEGILDYVKGKKLPQCLKDMEYRYLLRYLNSFDYLVVTDRRLEETLRREGVCRPRFSQIPPEGRIQKEKRAVLWLKLYQKIERGERLNNGREKNRISGIETVQDENEKPGEPDRGDAVWTEQE